MVFFYLKNCNYVAVVWIYWVNKQIKSSKSVYIFSLWPILWPEKTTICNKLQQFVLPFVYCVLLWFLIQRIDCEVKTTSKFSKINLLRYKNCWPNRSGRTELRHFHARLISNLQSGLFLKWFSRKFPKISIRNEPDSPQQKRNLIDFFIIE